MDLSNYLLALSLMLLPAFLMSSLYLFIQNRKFRLLRQDHEQIRKEYFILQDDYQELKKNLHKQQNFSDNLKEAEIATSLHSSRLSSLQQSQVRENDNPARYRHIHTLNNSGIKSDDVAEILSISSHEAAQLLKLSRLAAA